jgi:hypothetical protein
MLGLKVTTPGEFTFTSFVTVNVGVAVPVAEVALMISGEKRKYDNEIKETENKNTIATLFRIILLSTFFVVNIVYVL